MLEFLLAHRVVILFFVRVYLTLWLLKLVINRCTYWNAYWVFAWYDIWIGAYWDRKNENLYVFPLPFFGMVFMAPELVDDEDETELDEATEPGQKE